LALRFVALAMMPFLLVLRARGETAEAGEARIRKHLSGVGIPFIANAGQTDTAVAYYAPTFAGTVFITRDGRIVYSLPQGKVSASRDGPIGDALQNGKASISKRRSPASQGGWSLIETAVEGRAHPNGTEPASTVVSYFLGNDSARWRSGLPTFKTVCLGEVWPGIFLELKAHGRNVEKLFTVAPGVDPARIRMRLIGARRAWVSDTGALIVRTGLGDITFTPPVAYQERRGERHSIRAAYELHGREYGFRVPDYDPALPVSIDPLLQATYLGGSVDDVARAVAIHPTTGDVYVAGSTASRNFPGTVGGAQAARGGAFDHPDAFVARLNAALTTLDQATYLGGNGSDVANALAIEPSSGEVYVAGYAESDFPGTGGGAQAAYGGGNTDAFVARLNGALTALHQATYLGGNDRDFVLDLALYPTGKVYVAGYTVSTNLPGTGGGAQVTSGGDLDGFVARLNAALTTLDRATYLGGTSTDVAEALAIHPTTGDVYVAGYAASTNFPGTVGGAQAANAGYQDAFVAHLTASLATLDEATYLGGSDSDQALALAIHPTTGDVYVSGYTVSTNLPGTGGGAQIASGGNLDAFVARLNAALTTLGQSTYLGGDGVDVGTSLAIHPTTGEVYVAGSTRSTNFPGTTGGLQSEYGGGSQDAFVARLNVALTTLGQSTYLGGDGGDGVGSLAIHPTTGEMWAAGSTRSTNFPATAGGAQSTNGGAFDYADAFVARLTAKLAPPCSPNAETLCLNGSRFEVRTQWATRDGRSGAGQAVALTGDTGYFTFFSAGNVEMLVKVLNGCSFNASYWTFAGGLTDVNVTMTVTDTQTGTVRTYANLQGTPFQPIQDTSAFGCGTGTEVGLQTHGTLAEASPLPPSVSETFDAGQATACVLDATTLCLNHSRFKVQTQWFTRDGRSGAGQVVVLTEDTGAFWFFSLSNVEMVIKVLNGCDFNSRYWTFAGGLTDVNVIMTVTDTQTGSVKTYTNPQGTPFQPIQDTSAFATCP
jgi:hypothetical protein